jgi:hypothetical protein
LECAGKVWSARLAIRSISNLSYVIATKSHKKPQKATKSHKKPQKATKRAQKGHKKGTKRAVYKWRIDACILAYTWVKDRNPSPYTGTIGTDISRISMRMRLPIV